MFYTSCWRVGQRFESQSDPGPPSLRVWVFLVHSVTAPVGHSSDVKQRPKKCSRTNRAKLMFTQIQTINTTQNEKIQLAQKESFLQNSKNLKINLRDRWHHSVDCLTLFISVYFVFATKVILSFTPLTSCIFTTLLDMCTSVSVTFRGFSSERATTKCTSD